MPANINLTPTAVTDGVVYCTDVPLTPSEADIGDSAKTPDPIGVAFGQVIVAVVKLKINGIATSVNSYVVMQTDLGDGTWIDVAWIVTGNNQGTATFVLVGGGGITSNSFQQSRQSGGFPASNGSNQVPLGGRIRFVGKAVVAGGSSTNPGVPNVVLATVTYKLMAPR